MTTTVDVERIDIKEGPNRETLLMALERTRAFKERLPGIEFQTRFDEARFFDKAGADMRLVLAGARMFRGELEEIAHLGDDPHTANVFLVRVSSSLGTFEGHYYTRRRKGSLTRVR